jgi:hypothetical protein
MIGKPRSLRAQGARSSGLAAQILEPLNARIELAVEVLELTRSVFEGTLHAHQAPSSR